MSMTNGRLLLAPLLAFVAACTGGSGSTAVDGPTETPAPAASAALSTGSTKASTPAWPDAATGSPVAFADCLGIRAGDPMDFGEPGHMKSLYCNDGTQQIPMDCEAGMYVLLVRPRVDDLEGIVGQTTTWRKAEPIGTNGRTPWAFTNCIEHN